MRLNHSDVTSVVRDEVGGFTFTFVLQMNNGWVKSVDEEKDFGVLMSKDLKFSNLI